MRRASAWGILTESGPVRSDRVDQLRCSAREAKRQRRAREKRTGREKIASGTEGWKVRKDFHSEKSGRYIRSHLTINSLSPLGEKWASIDIANCGAWGFTRNSPEKPPHVTRQGPGPTPVRAPPKKLLVKSHTRHAGAGSHHTTNTQPCLRTGITGGGIVVRNLHHASRVASQGDWTSRHDCQSLPAVTREPLRIVG